MMSDTSVHDNAPLTPDELTDLLIRVEDMCGRAADVLRAAGRAVIGEDLDPHADDVQTVLYAACEHVADAVEALGDRALRARTGGAA